MSPIQSKVPSNVVNSWSFQPKRWINSIRFVALMALGVGVEACTCLCPGSGAGSCSCHDPCTNEKNDQFMKQFTDLCQQFAIAQANLTDVVMEQYNASCEGEDSEGIQTYISQRINEVFGNLTQLCEVSEGASSGASLYAPNTFVCLIPVAVTVYYLWKQRD